MGNEPILHVIVNDIYRPMFCKYGIHPSSSPSTINHPSSHWYLSHMNLTQVLPSSVLGISKTKRRKKLRVKEFERGTYVIVYMCVYALFWVISDVSKYLIE